MFKPTAFLTWALFLTLGTSAFAQLPASPGAEGFGSIATGGRGGDVYYVTNRNSSGAGSFAYGVQNAPAAGRTIVFAVSGHIRLPSGSGGGLSIAKSKVTVAGQTAPGDGICFWNNTMNITGNDTVIRNIRWRYGKQAAGGDSVDIANSQRIILDHCDVMFSTDENLSSFGTPPEFFTFQWSVNAWGLNSHSCGGLWDINHATAHHTLWANNHTRNPKCISPSVFDWVNNVTFGWDNGFNMAASTDPIARVNIRGSYFIHGGNTTEAVYGGGLNTLGENIFKLHMSDSALDGTANGILDSNRTNYGMVNSSQYDQVATAWPQTVDGITGGAVIGTPVTGDLFSFIVTDTDSGGQHCYQFDEDISHDGGINTSGQNAYHLDSQLRAHGHPFCITVAAEYSELLRDENAGHQRAVITPVVGVRSRREVLLVDDFAAQIAV